MVMMHRPALLLTAALLLASWCQSALALEITAEVDRNPVRIGESLNLTITVSGKNGGAADPLLTPLQRDFDVLGTRTSNSFEFINGESRRSKSWIISLIPKRTGELRIPALSVGNGMTNAITLKVVDAQSQVTGSPAIFAEAHIENGVSQLLVQQQLVYVLRLYYDRSVRGAELERPVHSQAVITKLGQDIESQTTRDGKHYYILERRFVIYPERTGKLTIDGPTYTSKIANRNSDPRLWQFATNTQVKHGRANTIEIDVMPIPANAQRSPWIPARSVTIEEEWLPSDDTFNVGKATTRIIRLTVDGQLPTQVPEIKLSLPDGIKAYPEPIARQSHAGSEGAIALLTSTTALIPLQPGSHTLPEIRIPWWDTINNRQRYAVLSAKRIKVLPAQTVTQGNTAKPQRSPAVQTASVADEDAAASPASTSDQNSDQQADDPIDNVPTSLWPWISLALLTLWILTILLWLASSHKKRKKAPVKPMPSDDIIKTLRKACKRQDAEMAIKALQDYAKIKWGCDNLYEYEHRGAPVQLTEELLKLRQSLYGQPSDRPDWNAAKLLRSFQEFAAQQDDHEQTETQSLPPLYPI